MCKLFTALFTAAKSARDGSRDPIKLLRLISELSLLELPSKFPNETVLFKLSGNMLAERRGFKRLFPLVVVAFLAAAMAAVDSWCSCNSDLRLMADSKRLLLAGADAASSA